MLTCVQSHLDKSLLPLAYSCPAFSVLLAIWYVYFHMIRIWAILIYYSLLAWDSEGSLIIFWADSGSKEYSKVLALGH